MQVSVIIPVYNVEAHLRQCLDSVVRQTLTDIEIICVDDSSTDASFKILMEYAARDSRFQILTQDNAGPGAARNTGLERTTGEYLIFLDSDDWFKPDFLERIFRCAQETKADVTICQAVEFDTRTDAELPSEWMLKTQYLPGETFTPEEIAEHIFQFTYGWPWDKLYRTDFVRNVGLSYPALPNSEDLVFVFQSLALARRITVLKEILVHHRVNRMSSVSNIRRLRPDVPYYALSLLQDSLRHRGVYETFERSFLDWAMEFLIWDVASIEKCSLRRRYFQKMKRYWWRQTGIVSRPISYYNSRIACAKYFLVKYGPYPVFAVILAGYRAYKKLRRNIMSIPIYQRSNLHWQQGSEKGG